ncbi:MAG TPA: acyl-CoA dehydrogenase family protein [Ramlibacter sp.]|nr:acyl-CoA dehydrogenase family protein [Ramlibacter sp.]
MPPTTTETTPRQQDRLYHDLFTPEEAQAVRTEVRAFADAHVAPQAHAIAVREESVESFPRELFRKMGRAGLFAIPFGRENGGRGLKHRATATAVAIEELAYHSNSVAAIYDVHCILAGHALEYASPALRDRYLLPVTRGEVVGAFATSEPDASTDLSLQALGTHARLEGDTWVVNGRKRFITNSPVADFVVALCRTGDGMSMLLVDLRAPGVRVGTPDRKMGNKGQLTADIWFDEVRVPASHLVGHPGQGLRIALATLTYGRLGIAATGVGMAQAVFDESVRHLKTRRAFGKRIGEFQHWQFLLAERATEIECARMLYTKAALRLDQGVEFPEPEAAMAKFYATRLAVDIARDGVQVFGGYGFLQQLAADGSTYKVEQVYRDAKIAEIYEGTNEIQRMVIARGIFGKDVTG